MAQPTRKSLKRDKLRETMVVAEAISKTMRGNRSRDTAPELMVRRALWANGIRGYRVNVKSLPGTPDMVFPRKRLAIFIHGCFWHGCQNCQNYRLPKTNSAFWEAKLEENLRRDERAAAALKSMGYQVLTFWECQVRSDLETCASRVRLAVSEFAR
jgi:DNA mismatch endonuclease (patch repair protein)